MDCVTGNKSSPPKNGTNESAEQNIDKNSSDEYEIVDNDLSDNVINLSEDLSTLEASVEHCNVFAKKREKPEASNESSKNPDLTLKRQKTEKQPEGRQIDSLQMNRSSVEGFLPPKYKRGRRNRAKDEPETMFDQRIKTVLFCLAVLLLLGLAFFGMAWLGICFGLKLAQENSKGLTYYNISTQIEDLRKSLDAEIKQRREIESELKLIQRYWEELSHDKASTLPIEIQFCQFKSESELKLAYENSKDFSQDRAPTQREVEELRDNLYAEIKERRKTESELKLAQEESRRDKEKAENAIISVALICCTLFIVVLFGLGIAEIIEQRKAESERKLVQENLEELRRDKEKAENAAKDLQNSLDAEIEQRRKTESELKLAQENLEGMRRDKEKAENDIKRNLDSLARH